MDRGMRAALLVDLGGKHVLYNHIGVDLGSDMTRIFAGRGIVLSEPSVVAVDTATGEPVEYGRAAAQMVGRTIERGGIADYDVAERMLTEYLRRVCGRRMVKPRVMVTTPSGISTLQQRSLVKALQSAGARSVCIVSSPLAVAIGLSVDFSSPHGTTIVDIGKGTTDVAVLSMGGVAVCESARIAGVDFDEAIIKYARREHNILIGSLTAEKIKIEVGAVCPQPLEVAIFAKGLNQFTGLPQSFEISTEDVAVAVAEPAETLVKTIQNVLEQTPPELAADISREGIILTGGGALLRGMSDFLSERLSTRVTLADDPMGNAVRGTGKILSDVRILHNGNYRFRTLKDLTVD